MPECEKSPPKKPDRVKKRVFLTTDQKLALVKLCIENQGDFQVGKKGQFWAIIAQLLEQEVGVILRDPAG